LPVNNKARPVDEQKEFFNYGYIMTKNILKDNIDIQRQIDNIMSRLEYYRLFPDSEIMLSREIICNLFFELNSLINCDFIQNQDNILSWFSVINEERLLYFGNLNPIEEEAQEIKNILFKSNPLFENDFNYKKLIEYLFLFLINFQNMDNPDSEELSKVINNLRSLSRFFHVDYSQFKFKFEEFLRKIEIERIEIPKSFYIKQFMYFDYFLTNKPPIDTCEELKKLIDVAIIILKELENPCLINEQGGRILLEFTNSTNAPASPAVIEDRKENAKKMNKKKQIINLATTEKGRELTYKQIARRCNTSEQYVKNVMNDSKSN
jgi:hypothetical protein